MSRHIEVEPHLSELRRFAQALTLRSGAGAGVGRAEWLVQRSLNSVSADAVAPDGGSVRVLLFSAAVQHHRALLRQEKFVSSSEPIRGSRFADVFGPAARQPAEWPAVSKALAQLSIELREILLLVALSQFSYTEAAQALGLPLSDTFARLTRARVTFGQYLEAHEKAAAVPLAGSGGGAFAPLDGGLNRRRPAAQHLRLVK